MTMGRTPAGRPGTPQFPPTLPSTSVDPGQLVRISGHPRHEPRFGRRGANRFDDPNPHADQRYGTCYFGLSLAVALAETLLHDRTPRAGWFTVAPSLLHARYVISFHGAPLLLANLTGAALKRLGGNAALTGNASYKLAQRWSAAIHAHSDAVDGIVYMSRHKNDERAVVLFDRAAHKLHVTAAVALDRHPDFGAVIAALSIRAASV